MTDGTRTSEFWISILVLVAATVLVAIGKLEADQWMIVATGSAGAYAISRGLAKK